MASKSKKRRRVLGASCILAALIIAGSSFAWFTSSDEVTNRLAANADYGVRIVESFAAPKQWLPGQEINKDVYAVNTGNIDAFVRETVTSKITITRENTWMKDEASLTTLTAQDVKDQDTALIAKRTELTKLTPAERYVIEAGSFLAYMPTPGQDETTNNQVGRQVVSFSNNPAPVALDDYNAETKYTDFTPDLNGLYVFRRTIDVDSNVGAVSYRSEDFTYDAYYYVDGNYYKVKLTSVTPDNVWDVADDGVDTDGIISAADGVFFYDETTVETPTLSYDAGAHELIATIKGKYDPLTDAFYSTQTTGLNALGTAYDDALDAYDDALADYLRAYKNDSNASDAEKKAFAELVQAQIAFENAKNKLEKEEAHLAGLKTQLKAKEDALGTTTTSDTALYKQEEARKALYGENGTESSPGVGSFKALLTAAETAMNNAAEDAAAFRTEVLAKSNKTEAQADGATTSELVLQMTNEQFTELMSYCNDHNKFQYTSEYYQALRNYDAKKKEYDDATALVNDLNQEIDGLQNSVKDSITTLYGATAGNNWYGTSTGKSTDIPERPATATEASYLKTFLDAQSALGTEEQDADANGTAWQKYKDAKNKHTETADTSTSAILQDKYNKVVEKKKALDKARMDYELAVEKKDQAGDLIIHIGLKNIQTNETTTAGGNDVTTGGEAKKWQLLPTDLEDTSTLNGTEKDTATFYYTSILKGGETSAQLIDKVYLDSSVNQYMYKSFDFDLDVSLDSAQVVYDTDGTTVKGTAAEETFAKKVTIYNPQDYGKDATLLWAPQA